MVGVKLTGNPREQGEAKNNQEDKIANKVTIYI